MAWTDQEIKNTPLADRLFHWLISRDTGMSSMAIVAHMKAAPNTWHPCPLDGDDLGRCIRLLHLIPEYAARLDEMRDVSPQWAIIVDHWGELKGLYFAELHTGRTPTCNARIQELLKELRP